MNSAENKRMTDLAWDKLHDRLERDGLLDDNAVRREGYSFKGRFALSLAASLVLIACATIYILSDLSGSKREMMILSNSESTTLVKTLADGSVVYLASGSQITYPSKFDKEKREIKLKGDAFFEVAKDKNAPFIIDANVMEIKVLGTSFNVRTTDTLAPSLSVRTGLVQVTLRSGGSSGKVAAGETATVNEKSLKVVPTIDITQFSRYSDQIHFKDERLADVINVINRMTNSGAQGVTISVDKTLEERRLTATFTDNSPESIAQMICIALNLKYETKEDAILIYE
ncbi:MAG: FecR domain-containing protein [Bacteroidales bacterium]|nr:FecR domain-containing protein [Bacteroidales bacterium]